MATLPRIRNIDEFFQRWPMTAHQAQANADHCGTIEGRERREAEKLKIGTPAYDITWSFALDEFFTGHAFCVRACTISGNVIR